MLFKLPTGALTLLLAVESAYILTHRHLANRFKPVTEYGDAVAFDTATGQLCETLKTKSVAEVEQSEAEAAQKEAPCPPLPAPSADPILDKIHRYGISERCGGSGEVVAKESDPDSTLEFVANLPARADIR